MDGSDSGGSHVVGAGGFLGREAALAKLVVSDVLARGSIRLRHDSGAPARGLDDICARTRPLFQSPWTGAPPAALRRRTDRLVCVLPHAAASCGTAGGPASGSAAPRLSWQCRRCGHRSPGPTGRPCERVLATDGETIPTGRPLPGLYGATAGNSTVRDDRPVDDRRRPIFLSLGPGCFAMIRRSSGGASRKRGCICKSLSLRWPWLRCCRP